MPSLQLGNYDRGLCSNVKGEIRSPPHAPSLNTDMIRLSDAATRYKPLNTGKIRLSLLGDGGQFASSALGSVLNLLRIELI